MPLAIDPDEATNNAMPKKIKVENVQYLLYKAIDYGEVIHFWYRCKKGKRLDPELKAN